MASGVNTRIDDLQMVHGDRGNWTLGTTTAVSRLAPGLLDSLLKHLQQLRIPKKEMCVGSKSPWGLAKVSGEDS